MIEHIGQVEARQGWQDVDGNFYWPKGFRSRRTFPSMKQEGKCSYHCEVPAPIAHVLPCESAVHCWHERMWCRSGDKVMICAVGR